MNRFIKDREETLNERGRALFGDDIVIAGWAGLSTGVSLAEKEKEKLGERLSGSFIERAGKLSDPPLNEKDMESLKAFGIHYLHHIRGEGIFPALWDMGDISETGLWVDLKRIPVRQETIEICEVFSLSPYECGSTGSILIACKDGTGLVRLLKEKEKEAALIGKICGGNERIIINEEGRRYLEPLRRE